MRLFDAVADYLRGEFQGAQVSVQPHGIVNVHQGECEYEVEFAEAFVDSHSPEEIVRLLKDWHLASEMRRAEGLRWSVSDAGVRLASSN